ncbi:Wzz/FepE/Etk N-terminal domain-containing protein [Frigoribacterium sp. PhB116]|uniref:Wzz/FepE/Etk N-terminal domain-containing protein n=1 Tax=Frigoribacterium sp. PhB116 TaxID=2485174 RepID=UPI0010612901|nr:Wzz/FepE/Etk N-terminal domain-containing protein [Frigoribacterium sp. PhB116]TDT65499.1 capsular polysaccharide biosynthesis protein [Frigoribacterium sp. PhB116]
MTSTARAVVVDDRLDLGDYLRYVAQHLVVVVVAVVLGLAAGVGLSQLAPASYTAQATVFVRADAPGSNLDERSAFALRQVSSYAQLGTSAQVLGPVAQAQGVSLADLGDRVTVTNPVDTVVLLVSATDVTATGAAQLADTVAGRLSDTVDQIESTDGADGQTISLDLTAPAPVPTTSTGPSTVVLGLLGLLVGLGIGVALAIVLARTRPRVSTVDDVRRATGLPVVGQLPAVVRSSDDPDGRGASAATRTALRETVQNLRALRGGELPRVLLLARTDTVSEAAGVDGGLARAVVELGSTCALLQSDFDTRTVSRPSTVPDDALPEMTEADLAGYDRVPVPDVVGASTRSFVRSGVERFFADLRGTYDVTVVQSASDSHPFALRTVTAESDEVVLVVRAGATRLESLRSLTAELMSLDVEPIGVVLAGVPRWRRVLLRATWRDEDFRRVDRPGSGHAPAAHVRSSAPVSSAPVVPSGTASPSEASEASAWSPSRAEGSTSIADLVRDPFTTPDPAAEAPVAETVVAPAAPADESTVPAEAEAEAEAEAATDETTTPAAAPTSKSGRKPRGKGRIVPRRPAGPARGPDDAVDGDGDSAAGGSDARPSDGE